MGNPLKASGGQARRGRRAGAGPPRRKGGDKRPGVFGGGPGRIYAGDFVDTPIFDRAKLGRNAVIEGPAVVEQSDTTVVIPPGSTARVDAYLNIVIDVGGDAVPAASGNGAGPSKGA